MRNKTFRLAEAIRRAGPDGISEARLAWAFKLSFSSLRCNYRRYLLDLFPDLRYTNGVYTSDGKTDPGCDEVAAIRLAESVARGRP